MALTTPDKIMIVGMALNGTGGLVAVAKTQLAGGISARWDVEYVSTYRGGDGPLTQITITSKALWQINSLLRKRCIRLMHIHGASRGSFWRKSMVCALARLYRVPYVFQLHSGEFPIFYDQECGRLAKAWVRKTLRGSAAVIALTEQWKHSLGMIEPLAQIEVIPNPVSVPQQIPEKRAVATTVLYLGRLSEKKGVFDLIRAVPSVIAKVPDARFVVAGDEGIDAVRQLAKELGVDSRVETPGWIDGVDKEKAFAQADVLVLPSYFEGLPVCILEAMANGVPIVTTDVGGIPDVVSHDQSALMTQPGDVAGLSLALIELLTNRERRERLRAQAFSDAGRFFSIETIDRKLESTYQRVMLDGLSRSSERTSERRIS